MTETPSPPASLSLRRRILRRVLFVSASLATILAVLYAVENWRGQRVWNDAKSRLQAKGRTFDPAAFVPASVPDDQNIFSAPGMDSFIKGRSNTLSHIAAYKAPRMRFTNHSTITVAEVHLLRDGGAGDALTTGTVLNLEEAAASGRAMRCLVETIGASVDGPAIGMLTARDLEKTKPAQMYARSDNPIASEDLSRLFPTNASLVIGPAASHLRLEPTGTNTFRVTVSPPPGFTAEEYLAATDPLEADFNLVRQAVARPYARMEGDYAHLFAMPIPNFVLMRNVAQVLAQRAQCHLLLGQPEQAWRDLSLVRESCRMLRPSPSDRPVTLVAAMIEVAITGLYTQTIKDGLRLHAWREPQLTAIETQLAQINLLPLMSGAMDSEMVAVCAIFERSSPEEIASIFSYGRSQSTVLDRLRDPYYMFYKLAPRGWILQNMASLALRNQEVMETLDLAHNLVVAAKVDAFALREGSRQKRSSPYTWMTAAAVPNFAKALQTVARNQTRVNQALVACALERYRLAHGDYPGALESLLPQLIGQLPVDMFTGKPFKYHFTADLSYLLYSVGWNETDEGGVAGKGNLEGDWTWRPDSDAN